MSWPGSRKGNPASILLTRATISTPDVYGDLPRFLMPIAPLLLFSLRDSIPRDRRVLWPAALLAAVLASAAMVGFRSVLGFRVP